MRTSLVRQPQPRAFGLNRGSLGALRVPITVAPVSAMMGIQRPGAPKTWESRKTALSPRTRVTSWPMLAIVARVSPTLGGMSVPRSGHRPHPQSPARVDGRVHRPSSSCHPEGSTRGTRPSCPRASSRHETPALEFHAVKLNPPGPQTPFANLLLDACTGYRDMRAPNSTMRSRGR